LQEAGFSLNSSGKQPSGEQLLQIYRKQFPEKLKKGTNEEQLMNITKELTQLLEVVYT